MMEFNERTGEFEESKDSCKEILMHYLELLGVAASDALVFYLYSYGKFGLVRGLIYALFWPMAIPIDMVF